jgi:hypothetical protein
MAKLAPRVNGVTTVAAKQIVPVSQLDEISNRNPERVKLAPWGSMLLAGLSPA